MKKQPFHESIIPALQRVTTIDELNCLAQLIRQTVIPKNHQAILSAWTTKYKDFFAEDGVDVDVTTQSLVAAMESAAPPKQLDELTVAQPIQSSPVEQGVFAGSPASTITG